MAQEVLAESIAADYARPLATPATPAVDALVDEVVLDDAEEIEEEEPRRTVWGLMLIISAIVIIILLLLLIPDCSGAQATGHGGKGGNTIEDVSGMQPVSGAVSLWIEKDANVNRVINRAGVTVTERVDMGGGRFVLQVAPGREQQAADRLIETSGVYDAGRVFSGNIENAK